MSIVGSKRGARGLWFSGLAGVGLVMACLTLAGAAQAANPADPTWPCIQRKVEHISIGQMWTGPLPAKDAEWRKAPRVAALAPRLAARRTSLEEAQKLVDAFAGETPPEGKAERLALLFAGVFQLIDSERSRLINGIGRYAKRQATLSHDVDALRDKIAAKRETTAKDDYDALDALEKMEDELTWRTRIYDDRRQSLTYVCESPVIMEKRAFAIARMLAAHLPG